MNLSFYRGIAAPFLALSCVSLIGIGLSGCGGGGGSDSDDSTATIRPKTLDGLVLKLDSNVTFEFIRNAGGAGAVSTGQVETGTFFYTLGGIQLRQYPNQQGDNSDVRYPDSTTGNSYSYRAVNESSGVLTLFGVGVNDLNTTGNFNANNGSFTYFFNSDSSGIVINQVEIDLTFESNGVSVDTGVLTVRIPGSSQPNYDTVRIPTAVTLAPVGPVPLNYNPTIDFSRPSRITPASLNNLLMRFTNGIPDPALDFTIQFAASATTTPGSTTGETEEVGQGLLRVSGAVVDNAVNYTWLRIGGTDTGTLSVTGSNLTYDGVYTLNFTGPDNGNYAGQVDGGTANANEVTGSFRTQ